MAGINIGPRIGIDGEAQFRKELSQINQALKTLDSEGKLLTATMERETDAEKKNAAQKDLLGRKMITQKEAVDKIRQALNDSARMFGESDERTLRWQRSLNEATADLRSMENQLARTDGEVEEIGGDMQNAEKDTKGWVDVLKGSLLSNAITSGFKVLKDAAVAAAKAIGDVAMEGAAYADDMLTLSQTTHIGTDTLQEYKYMADLIDVDLNTITGSLSKMTKQMSGARDGTGAAAEAWETLGVRIEDDNGQLRKSEDVFNDTISALKKVENETERDTIAMSLFGKSAQDLNPLIETGGDRLAELSKEAHDVGYVMSGSALRSMQKLKDATDRMDKSAEAASNRFASGLTPSLTKAADAINQTLASPRVRRGLDDASAAIGSLIEGVTDLGMNALTGLLDVIGLVDPALRYLTDDELEFLSRTKDATAAWEEATDRFRDSVDEIDRNTENTYALWNELEELASAGGRVNDADKARAQYILGELSEALGQELTMTGNQIDGYNELKQSIEDLIAAKQAESLLSAYDEKNQEAMAGYNQVLQDVLNTQEKYEEGLAAIVKAEAAAKKAEEDLAAAYNAETDEYNRLLEAQINAHYTLNDTHDAYDDIIESYQQADELLDQYTNTLETYEKAQRAMAEGSYNEAVDLLTRSNNLQRRRFEQSGLWNRQEFEAYRKLQQEKQRELARAEAKLAAGVDSYSRERIAKLRKENEDMLREMRAHTIDYEAAGEEIGNALGAGLSRGIDAAAEIAERKARQAMQRTIKGMNAEAQIKSPSRKTEWSGEMLIGGLGLGMERRTADAERQARRAMSAVLSALDFPAPVSVLPPSELLSGAHRASQAGSTTNTYNSSMSMGGVTIHVSGANVDNVDQLAGLVAVKLNDELQRTRSARGAWA